MDERNFIHELKIWPEHYRAVAAGEKTFEIRINDRDYQVGNALWLREWNPETKDYTPNTPMIFRRIVHVHSGLGMAPGYVVLGIEPFPPALDLEVPEKAERLFTIAEVVDAFWEETQPGCTLTKQGFSAWLEHLLRNAKEAARG